MRQTVKCGRVLPVLAILLAPTMLSCTTTQRAAIELDKVAHSLDKYGFASISTPFLASPQDEFQFDLDKNASDFFDMAMNNVQGGVRNFSSQATDVQLSVKFNLEQALAAMDQFNKAKTTAQAAKAKQRMTTQLGVLTSLAAQNPAVGKSPLVSSMIQLLTANVNQPSPEEGTMPDAIASTDNSGDDAGGDADDGEGDKAASPSGPPIPTADRLALGAVGPTFTPGLTGPTGPFSLSARQAMLIASGDDMTQSLLRWFTNPRGSKLKDYELIFCPVIVSVQPGYKTRDGYLADITVNLDLARNNGSKLEFLSARYPNSSPPIHVAGVFPVLDSQILDLANSRRKLFSAAFQLSMLGFGQQANFMLDYAKKLEHDAQTRSALTVASAYTAGGNAFGFRVEPRFVASKDPTSFETAPGRILESKTFPALAVVLVNRRFLYSQEDCEDITKNASPADGSPLSIICDYRKPWKHKSSCKVLSKTCKCRTSISPKANEIDKYPYLVFQTNVRWSPTIRWKNGAASLSKMTPDPISLLMATRYKETESWKRAQALDNVEHLLTRANNPIAQGMAPVLWNVADPFEFFHIDGASPIRQADEVSMRAISIRKLALGSQALMSVWHSEPAKQICVRSVSPDRGWVDQYTVLTIRGSGFRGNVDAVTVGGIMCEFVVPNDKTLLVLVPPWVNAKTSPSADPGGFAGAVQKNLSKSTLGISQGTPLMGLNKGSSNIAPMYLSTTQPTTKPTLCTWWEILKGLCKGKKANDDCDLETVRKADEPPPPMTEQEKKLLKSLSDRLAACVACKEGKNNNCVEECEILDKDQLVELFFKLRCKDQQQQAWKSFHDWNDAEEKKKTKKQQVFVASWAQIVIASDKPVRVTNDLNGTCSCFDNYCETCESFPQDAPVINNAPTPLKLPNSTLGWIKFDKKISSSKTSTTKKGKVEITRDSEGRIIGVKTGDGGFANAMELLRMIAKQLGGQDNLSLEIHAGGQAAIRAGTK